MEKDPAMWSSLFAHQMAEALGYAVPGSNPEPSALPFGPEEGKIVREVTEAFRYLPPTKIQQALDFAWFLRKEKIDGYQMPPSIRRSWAAEKLIELRDLVLFLRGRYGREQPADEDDEWSDEDRRDMQLAARRRLEEEDPYPWPEDPENAHAG
jgi:hypothetical protein